MITNNVQHLHIEQIRMIKQTLTAITLILAAMLLSSNPTQAQKIEPAGLQVFIGGAADVRPIPYYYLNSPEKLVVSFDLLNYDNNDIYYNIYRQQAYGEPPLQQIQYLDNPQMVDIPNGATSMSTKTPYIHYKVAIPNQRMKPLMSGDYVIEFYSDQYQNKGDGFLMVPFTVVEPLTSVELSFPFYAIGVDTDTHQQVNVSVNGQGEYINNPTTNNMSVRVWQNFAQRGINLTQPSSLTSNQVLFQDDKGARFPGGNEYFHFDLLYPQGGGNIQIDSIKVHPSYYEAFLPVRGIRINKPYLYESDMDGLYRVHTAEFTAQNIDVDGEYELVRFNIDCNGLNDFNPQKENIFIIGQAFGPWGKQMHYDPQSGLMTYLMMVKQGYLDYAFVRRNNNYEEQNLGGDHRQTTNTYTALVYVNSPMDISYKVIGATTLRRTMTNSTSF